MNACVTGNLALHKPAFQISTYLVSLAGLAVDDLPGSEACTYDHGDYPWWAVDLKGEYDIGRVVVTSGYGNCYSLVH